MRPPVIVATRRRPGWLPGLILPGLILLLAPGAVAQGAGNGEDARGQGGSARAYAAALVEAPVAVDGVLDEAVWRSAERIPLPYETFPGRNAPAPVETDCRIAYDDRALYLGCEAGDPSPERLRAYITDRDRLDGQDRIVLGLAPHDDGRRAFLFGVNPLGVQSDAMLDEARQQADLSWDVIWESAGRIGPEGYVVEAAVPFRSLRFPERDGAHSWSFYVERFWPRQADVRVQSFFEDEGESCRLCQLNRLTGLTGITSGGAIQLTPTVSAVRSDARPLGDDGWSSGDLTAEAGLDVEWSVTSDVTLNATVNPDFSQVEADVAQLEVNRRFALFYPEQRPFFQEGADLFSSPLDLVFTRTIVDPDVGGKATGKVGANAFGALVSRDLVTGILVPGPYRSSSAFLEEPVWTGIGIYRRDVASGSTVGGLVTVREGAGYHNRVASVDALLRPLSAVQIQAQVATSSTDYPDGVPALDAQPDGPFTGSVLFARALFDNRTWFANVGLARQAAGFRADAGFVPSTDLTQHWGFVSRRWYGTSDSFLSELRLSAGAWSDVTHSGGEPVSRGVWFVTQVRGPGQSMVFVNPNLTELRFEGRDFDVADLTFGGEASPTRWLSASVNGLVGTGIDVANARRARELRLEPAVTLRPGRRLETRLSYVYQQLRTEGGGDRILEAGVSELRTVYNLSHRAFVRAILQYRRTEREPQRFQDPVVSLRESALSQLLFSYKVNPRTALYLGYSDNRQGVLDTDASRTHLTPTGRSFFFKVGYAFQP